MPPFLISSKNSLTYIYENYFMFLLHVSWTPMNTPESCRLFFNSEIPYFKWNEWFSKYCRKKVTASQIFFFEKRCSPPCRWSRPARVPHKFWPIPLLFYKYSSPLIMIQLKTGFRRVRKKTLVYHPRARQNFLPHDYFFYFFLYNLFPKSSRAAPWFDNQMSHKTPVQTQYQN